MNTRHQMWVACVVLMAMSVTAHAQSSNRGVGWEFGTDLIYLDSTDVSFDGGSRIAVDDDLALAITFGYRFSSRLELQFALDWQSVDYRATLQSALLPSLSIDVSGEYESFTPRVSANYNFIDGAITPYVTGGIGWSFIDTNIPNGRVQVGCWWDPWYGQICTPYQSTASTDGFTYQLGVGVRWDSSGTIGMRLGYEKHWYDFDNASGSPDFDQLKLGIFWRY